MPQSFARPWPGAGGEDRIGSQDQSRALAESGPGAASPAGTGVDGTIVAEGVTKQFEGGVLALDDVDLFAR
ncbi:MAG TPA: hypothetical protein VFY37_00450, partial [Solirubrobacterales bacterium]|nr:hypothetical protein [Solirubrobacterales bacterium]